MNDLDFSCDGSVLPKLVASEMIARHGQSRAAQLVGECAEIADRTGCDLSANAWLDVAAAIREAA